MSSTLEPKPDAERGPERRASWIPAADNRFGVPILDLIAVTGDVVSTTNDPQEAARSLSWSSTLVTDLSLEMTNRGSFDCDLLYVAEATLPDGWLFTPSAMEQKWAIAYRDHAIYLLRSWTGEVKAIGRTRRDAGRLVIERIELADDTLQMFGDPIEVFDWILRAHALGDVVPLPVTSDGAAILESAPLSMFSLFGNVASCATTRWSPARPERSLRSTGDIITAVRSGQETRVSALVNAGASLDARSPVGGLTALHVAVIQGSVALTRLLLELGADPNALADGGASTLITAVVHRVPLEILDLLATHGAVATTPNADGFSLIHAIAETDHAEYIPWSRMHDLDLEARTKHGHTALHIAAALGHVTALRALIAVGADRGAKGPSGETARDIALAEGKFGSVAALDDYR